MTGYLPRTPKQVNEAEVLRRLIMITARMDGWTTDIKTELRARYNPNQPRASRGTPIGGQWVDSGGGHASGGRFGVPKPARDGWLRDAMTRKPPHLRSPNDVLEGGAGGGLSAPRAPSAPSTPMP